MSAASSAVAVYFDFKKFLQDFLKSEAKRGNKDPKFITLENLRLSNLLGDYVGDVNATFGGGFLSLEDLEEVRGTLELPDISVKRSLKKKTFEFVPFSIFHNMEDLLTAARKAVRKAKKDAMPKKSVEELLKLYEIEVEKMPEVEHKKVFDGKVVCVPPSLNRVINLYIKVFGTNPVESGLNTLDRSFPPNLSRELLHSSFLPWATEALQKEADDEYIFELNRKQKQEDAAGKYKRCQKTVWG